MTTKEMNKPVLYLIVFFMVILFNSQKNIEIEKPTKMSEVEFYSQYTNQPEIIQKVNNINQYYHIDLSILIAIMAIESNFNPLAINQSNVNGSVDRGLFQTNSNYFNSPYIYDATVNIANGIAHYNYCLDITAGNIKNSLRLYNGGYYKRNDRTEKYVENIINYQIKMKLAYMSYLGENQ